MKKSKKIILGFLIPVILIGGGMGSFLIIGFLNYAVTEESYSFYYKPAISVEPEIFRLLILSDDPREVIINYNTSSVPYYIKADVNLKAEGIYMRDSDYNFFDVYWYNDSIGSITELNVYTAPYILGLFYHPTWTVKYKIAVNLTLRTDILYDLQLNASST